MRYQAIVILLGILLTGCSARKAKPRLPDVIFPIESLTEPPIGRECDTRTEPPKCKSLLLKYRKGTEKVQVSADKIGQ